MPSIKKDKKTVVTEAQLTATETKAEATGEVPFATVGSNSENVSTAFVHGRNITKSYDEAAEELRTSSPAVQEAKVRELKIGLIVGYLSSRVESYAKMTDLEAYQAGKAILDMAGKQRTALEAKAEVSARTEVSRLFSKYEIENLNSKGGHNKLTKEEREAKAKATRIANAKKTLGITDVVKPADQVQLAAFVIPDIATVSDYTDHLKLVQRGLADSLKKAESHISGTQLETIVRPQLKAAMDALKAIADALAVKADA